MPSPRISDEPFFDHPLVNGDGGVAINKQDPSERAGLGLRQVQDLVIGDGGVAAPHAVSSAA